MKITTPKVYLIGSTTIDREGLANYLRETGNEAFMDILTGVDSMDICSFYAKLCYKSLTLGHNANITRIRDIESNFINCIETGHGSVLEHASLNFVAENVSRIETTEQIRHRAGQAISAESGRYVMPDWFRVWVPTVIAKNPAATQIFIEAMEKAECAFHSLSDALLKDCKTFAEKKEATSAARRVKPLGAGETLGFSLNLRSIRHIIQMRTSRHAEEEIRIVFNQVAQIILMKIPLLLQDMASETVNGHTEWRMGK